MIHIWRPWKVSNFEDTAPSLSIYVRNSSTPLTLDVQFQTTPLPLQVIINKLKEDIIQGWLLYVIRSLLQLGFRFQYQLINLVWLSFDFFSFSWSLYLFFVCFFFWLYTLVCSVVQKYQEMSFIYNYSHFLVFILQSNCFFCTTWKHKETMERNHNKNKTKPRRIQIDHVFSCWI